MSSSSNPQLKVGCNQDASHSISNLSERVESPFEPPEVEDEDQDEDGDVDFNPFLNEAPSPEASSSLSSEVEVLDVDAGDSDENTIASGGIGSSKLSEEVQGFAVKDSEHEEDEIVMQASDSPGGLCGNELEKHMPGEVKKRKSVFFSEPEIETVQVEENGASSGTDVNNEVGARKLSSITRYRNPLIDFDDEDAICKRTRARYSLASFTLDELETFLQETDDEDDLQNVDDEEEYKKFLAAVLLGGDGDSQADQENENVDDEDEDNDADFEIEIEEALESDLDENIGEKTEKDEYEEASRRPETRQNKRKKTCGNNQRKHLQLANRPLRPLVPIMPNAPFHPFDGRSLMPEAAPQCLSLSAEDGFTNGFTPQQIGHLHCLIYEHVQLLIQVFSLCVLDPSRQHIASQVQGLISEMLHKRGQALAWRHVPYPAFWFCHSYIHPLGAAELPKGYPGQCISESSLTPNAQRDSSSLEMLHLHNTSPSEGRYENVYSEQTGFSQTIGGVSWLPFTGGPLLSILDVAPLNLVERYMDDVKIAVQEYRQRLLEDTCDPRVNKEPLFPLSSFPSFAGASAEVSRGTNPPSADKLPSSSPSHQPPKKTLAATLVESSKKQSVALVPKEIVKLSQRFFPLFNPALFPRKPPLASVANRVLFTDAEDELLAMGLMEYNTDWKAIQQRFLPCKSKHQIFVRQKNRCSSKAPDNPIKAVKRMKNSPLTADEQARIQEGLRIFKHDWMSVWKFIVPHRDPSLLPRQWRIALGTQKSYKIDASKKERRRLYESKRRKSIADLTNWKNVPGKEDCRAEILGENNSGEDSIDNEDEAYVHEAFLADWRPSSSSLRSSELPCISGQLNNGGSGESQPRNNNLKEFPHALMNTGHPYTSSHFTQVRYGAPNTVKPNHLLPDLKSSKTPFYMRPYRARRANNAHLVKLAPDLPPVNLPSSARVISQAAVKSYQCEPSPKVSIAGEGIDGVGIEKGVAKLPIITKSRTTNLMEVRQTRTNSPEHNITASHPEESRVFRDKCVTEENGTESDLQMHPLLFRAPDDGHLPYYPLKCSINSPSSFSFFSRSQPEVSLSLFHNPHQADPTVNCFNESGKSKETKPTSFGVDFHPLLQRTADGNSDSVAACSTAHLSVDLESLRGGFAHLQNSSDANQSESRITCDPSATSTKPYSQKDNEKANDLDLEIHLSSTCRMEKAIGGKLVTQHNSVTSTVRTLNVETQNTKTPYCGLSATTRSELVDAPVFATTSNNISRCSMGNVGDRCLPEIVMEQEELSDSDEEIGGHVEFECEEMADSEGDDESDCEQIADTQNKEAPNCAVEKVSKIAGGDDQQCELRAQGDSQGDACIPRKDGTPLTLGLTSQGKDIKSCSSWLSLDSCAPGCLPHAKTKHVESIEGKGPDKSCKKMTPRAKRATMPKHEADMPQQLSLGPLAVNPIKKVRKRAGRTSLNLNTEATVESSDCAANAVMEPPHESLLSLLQRVLTVDTESSEPEICPIELAKPQNSVNLCLGSLAQQYEETETASNISFSPDIQLEIAAIARRRKLLKDDILIMLAGSSWEILDVSGSDVSDVGLAKVATICKSLRAVDISCCSKITEYGVSELVKNCQSLEILRCGGCPDSNNTARRCLDIFKLIISTVERDSWEEFDGMETCNNAHSLRWLMWPEIDEESRKRLAAECPRIVLNPQPSLLTSQGTMEVPREALMDVALDELVLDGIDIRSCGVFKGAGGSIGKPSLNTAELFIVKKGGTACLLVISHVVKKKVKYRRQSKPHARSKYSEKDLKYFESISQNFEELDLDEEEFFEPEIPAAIVEQYENHPQFKRASKKKKKDRRVHLDF